MTDTDTGTQRPCTWVKWKVWCVCVPHGYIIPNDGTIITEKTDGKQYITKLIHKLYSDSMADIWLADPDTELVKPKYDKAAI